MAENSNIEWTDHTFNPWIGCTKVSPGCAHCYAERQDRFRSWTPDGWGRGKPRKITSKANWKKPLAWNNSAANEEARIKADIGNASEYQDIDYSKPRVFCASLADWLDPEVPSEWLAWLLDLIGGTPHLNWLLLTKRPELFHNRVGKAALHDARHHCRHNVARSWGLGTPPENVWLGVSVEDQDRADERIPHLEEIPAATKFLSCEPLLGPLDLSAYMGAHCTIDDQIHHYSVFDWVIVGGESGPKARSIKEEWVCRLRDQCDAAQVAFFFKQWGGLRPSENGRLLDGLIYDGVPA